MNKLIALLLFLCFSFCSYSQSDAFNFWIGDWELSWSDQNNDIVKGQNKIEKTLNGHVIQENFNSLEDDISKRFIGKSWTVFNPQSKKWKQTWVDNSGAYLDFEGFIEDGKTGFRRSYTNPNGEEIYQRMVFYNITENAFTWDWENSKDNKSWTLAWRINYQRKPN